VVLHLELENNKVRFPLKFNFVWLEDPKFVKFVKKNWGDVEGLELKNLMDTLVKKTEVFEGIGV